MKYLQPSVYIVFLLVWPKSAVAKKDLLTVSPKVCVVSEQQDFCDLDLKFVLNMPDKMDVCLYHEKQQLQCWQQVTLEKFNHKARVQVETIYSLVNPHTDELLATTRIEVQSTHAKTTRRRLRSPWSFF
ncbi:DUF3019 domain-containing protein [Pseudoalteromonas arctica]|uniref:DUF3019 domain-containing protein n=1 Tax=Pseudoalteromonas arctica TaxID=394751 RepID=A0A7Y0DSI7_9GAMM|nr:DUF3019 domain-containing protein [Pseudoalteromonas arctica]NMM40784.1 DUF3019 domain-containing protein [Pseudoalteromonas arctica]